MPKLHFSHKKPHDVQKRQVESRGVDSVKSQLRSAACGFLVTKRHLELLANILMPMSINKSRLTIVLSCLGCLAGPKKSPLLCVTGVMGQRVMTPVIVPL